MFCYSEGTQEYNCVIDMMPCYSLWETGVSLCHCLVDIKYDQGYSFSFKYPMLKTISLPYMICFNTQCFQSSVY